MLQPLPHLTGPRVLEIGPGPGHLLLELRKKGVFAVGIDASWSMNRVLLKNTTQQHLNTMQVHGYAQLLPFPASSFDQVISTFPAEFIYDHQTLQQIHRILQPGGELIILPGAWIHSKKLFDRFLAWLFRFSGLSPDWSESFLTFLRSAGFHASSQIVDLGDSSLILIFARKPTN